MSPVIVRSRGYRVIIFTNDHPPAHIHVRRAGKKARVRLEPVELLNDYGYSSREIKQILKLVQDNQTVLLTQWDRYHTSR